MVTKLGAAWLQAGITSWGKGCDQHTTPGVYTRVSEYQIWISSIVEKNLPGFVRSNIIYLFLLYITNSGHDLLTGIKSNSLILVFNPFSCPARY